MATPAFPRQKSTQFLTAVYLGLLGIVMLGLGAFIWWLLPASNATAQSDSFITNETADAYAAPADFEGSKNVRLALLEQATPEQSASRVVQRQLADLQRYIRNLVTGKATVRPTWIDKSFASVGIDPDKCPVKINDPGAKVCRYRRTETAPKFSGNRAFEQFVANTMAASANSGDFQIKLRLENLKEKGEIFTATVLAESVGSREQNNDERVKTSSRRRVIQVSSVWQTTWSKASPNEYQLLTAEVPATEIVTLGINEPRMFYDCTDSIIGKNRCFRQQLIYGVDQWASKLPGIDTQGNSGLSIGDINDDGLDDIYLCQPQGIANRLLIQKQDGTAIDESLKYGVNMLDESRSSLMIDLDNDGDQDLVVATKSSLVFMSNTNEGRFEIIKKLDRCCDGLSLSAADFDNDGDVDLFLSREPKPRANVQIADPAINLLAGCVLLRNDESFRFVDVTATVGLVSENPMSARSAVWFDRDLDGDQDLYVAGEKGGIQFVNNDGFFKRASEVAASGLPNQKSASTGDFNRDGRFDLLVASQSEFGGVSNHESHISFGGYENSTKPFFLRAPLFDDQYATSSLVADLNNDGRDDLVIGNGGFTRVALDDLSWLFPQPASHPFDQQQTSNSTMENQAFFDAAKLEQYSIHSRQRNRCYASIGAGGFAEVSAASGLNYADDSRALAATDWDQDGDVDVLVVNRNGPQLRFFINNLNRGNAISFRLQGETSNRDAIGARVEVKVKGAAVPLIKTVQAGGGFLSQSSKRLTFGVGEAKKIESVVVRWPSGKVHHFKQLRVGEMYELAEGSEEPVDRTYRPYRLKIRGSNLAGSVRQPALAERTLFVPRFPMPSPEVQVAAGQWNSLRTLGEQPSVLLFWGQNSQSEQALQQLNRFVDKLEKANATVVTVFADSSNLRPDEQWKYLRNFAENFPQIKNWTSLSDGGLETMKIVFGHWFSKRELPKEPFALLVDKDMNVVGMYPFAAFEKEKLLDDLKRCDYPPVFADQASNEAGFWTTTTFGVDSRKLANRLRKAGFDSASDQLLANVSDEVAEDLTVEAKDFAALGRDDLAQQFYAAALAQASDNISALLGRSNLAINHALAASHAGTNNDSTYADTSAVPVGDSGLTLPEAKAGFERVLKLKPQEWQAAIGIAKVQLLQNRPEQALEILVEYYETNPRVEVLAMQGRVLFQSGNYNEASRKLERAYNERPNLPYLAGDLGYLYLLNDEPKFARKLLRKAHRLQPSDLTFLRMLAEVEFLTGNFNRSVDLYTKVNRLQPDQIRSKNVLAWLLATCPYEAKRDGAAALALIDAESENLVDQDAATLEIYAACYAEVGEFGKAVRFQQLAVDKVNDDASSQNYTKPQLKGMLTRLELYRTRQPYRTANTLQTPIQANGSRLTDGKFRALRF